MWINFQKIVAFLYICTTFGHTYRYDSVKYNHARVPGSTLSPVRKQSAVSRFENLNRVNNRLDSFMSSDSKHRLRHSGRSHYTTTTTTEENLFEEYGDFVNEYDDNEYDDDKDDVLSSDDLSLDDEDNEEESDLETLFSEPQTDDDMDNSWQAEEPTEKPTVSTFTKFKWDKLGTRKDVMETRRQHLQLSSSSLHEQRNAVIDHYNRVREEITCQKPMPRVISVQSEHPNPSKRYTPHCTVLHRCTDDTGCCSHGSSKCQVKSSVPVHLYFYIQTLGKNEAKVEKLMFHNHTECECKDPRKNATLTAQTENFGASTNLVYSPPENYKKCNCPTPFKSVIKYDMKCMCDCEKDNKECISFKMGEEHFSYTFRKCISDNQCGVPICEHGSYAIHRGKCPSKQEKLENFRRIKYK